MKIVYLKPIKETPNDYDEIETQIMVFFRREIYLPLLKELGIKKLRKNSVEDLAEAIQRGRIVFYRGEFRGDFDSTTSRALKQLGAQWNRKHGSFSIPHSKLPLEIRNAISLSEASFLRVAENINKKLAAIDPKAIAANFKIQDLFERVIWKTNKTFEQSVKGITVSPTLTEHSVNRIATEYTENLQLYIQDFVGKETEELRKRVIERSTAGFRRENLAKEIEASYGVSQRKAKFLAKQETSLLMAKFKQTRYQETGVNEYKWGCVKMPHAPKNGPATPGEVRYHHGILEGKIFKWSDPPIVNEKGDRKNPGQDYNCRCFPIPIVKF